MCICYLYIFFGEVSVQVFVLFFNGVVFLLLSFTSSLCISDNSRLSDVSFANIFSHSSHCLDTVFHRAEIFNLNKVQLINYFFHGSYLSWLDKKVIAVSNVIWDFLYVIF